MMKYAILASTTAVLLLAGPAQAYHCENKIAEVELLLAAPATDDANLLDTAEALLAHGIAVCEQEEQQLADAEPDSPMLDPDYVTIGQANLIHAGQLAGGY